MAVNDLRKKSIFKILSYAYNEQIFKILQNLRFSHSNALEYDLKQYKQPLSFTQIDGIEIKYIGEEYDEEIYNHWKRM